MRRPGHAPCERGRSSRVLGFTLVETLVAAVLGSMLVIGVAVAGGLFSTQVEDLHQQLDTSLEESLAEILDSVSQAWLVDQPGLNRIETLDPFGLKTEYYLDGSDLMVSRPSGTAGVLLTGVASLTFDVALTRRLRDASELDSYGVWFQRNLGGGGDPLAVPILGSTTKAIKKASPYYDPSPVMGLTMGGDALALGFMLSAKAPASVKTVDDIDEDTVGVTLDRVLIPIAHLPLLPNIPVNTKYPFFLPMPETAHSPQTVLCHYPQGNPQHPYSIAIGQKHTGQHLIHGDTLGACVGAPGGLTIELYDGRTQGDARPYGTSKGSVTIPAASLPLCTWNWRDITFSVKKKFHVKVAYGADPAVIIDPPMISVPIDLGGLSAQIEPGVPYTLVLSYTGTGTLAVRRAGTLTASMSGVAVKSSGEADFSPQAMEVQLSLDGMRTFTQTDDHDVISRLTATIDMEDGSYMSGSAIVASQSNVGNPWLGSVPGELPSLQTTGQ